MAAPVLQFKRGLLANLPGLRAGEPGFTTDSYDLYVGIDSTTNNNKFFGSHRYWNKETASTGSGLRFVERTDAGSNYIELKAPNTALGSNVTFTLPAADGAANQVIYTDGSGNLGFTTVSANFSIAGDTGTDNVTIGTDTLTIAGTANEIETAVTNNQVQIGLPNNVIVGNALTVTGPLTANGDVNLGNASGDTITVVGVATFTTSNVYVNNQLFVGGLQVTGGGSVIGEDITTRNFKATGVSTFVGAVTFEGGTINLGDSDADDINVAGEFISNLVPNTDNTYDIGIGSKRWRHGSFSGIVTAATGVVADGVQIGINGANVIDTVSGNLTLNSAGGTTIIDDFVNIQNNLNVTGNVTIGGTTLLLTGEDVFIKNKDIILGYTTNTSNADISTDDTANHAGVAIASTEGTPLVSFTASGINTLPDTYKQIMWFKSGTLGFATDTFAFNYGVAIGTTTMANGIRLAVGSGITMTDTEISATTFRGTFSGNASSADQVKTVTASDTNATYYVTFVDANNGSATNETVYTDDGIYYNPGTNTFTTQNALFTGNVTVQGTLTGTATTATNANFIDITSNTTDDNTYYIPFESGIGYTSLNIDTALYYNPGQNKLTVTNLAITDINATGVITATTFVGALTGTATTATRATTVDTTSTSANADYYVTFVDTLAGESGETIRVGAGLSLNPSTGDVKTGGRLSVGNPGALTSYIKAGGGSDAIYLYANGDVAFQQKVIVGGLRSSSNSNNTLTLNDLDATFAGNLAITGITTVGTGVGITQFSGSVSTGTSTSSVPTSSAVIDYVGNQISNVDLTTSLAGDTGTGSVNTSQTLTVAGTVGEIETSASGQTITIGLPNDVIVGTSLSAPTVKTATIQHRNGTQAATIDTSGNITASQNLTVSGNLYVSGSTTQVNTDSLTVEDRTIELGVVNGSTPGASTTWDLGVLFNYNSSGAKKSGVIWEHGDGRFKFGSQVSDGGGTDNDSPQITVSNYAAIEIGGLWVNDCAGSSQVINCSGTTRTLENITIDAGTF